jgi:hypothetical protein
MVIAIFTVLTGDPHGMTIHHTTSWRMPIVWDTRAI